MSAKETASVETKQQELQTWFNSGVDGRRKAAPLFPVARFWGRFEDIVEPHHLIDFNVYSGEEKARAISVYLFDPTEFLVAQGKGIPSRATGAELAKDIATRGPSIVAFHGILEAPIYATPSIAYAILSGVPLSFIVYVRRGVYVFDDLHSPQS